MDPTLVIAAVLIGAIAVLFCIGMIARDHKNFAEKFPPISDAEFMALCRPGTSPRVALTVRRVVAEHLAVNYEQIYPSTNFIEDLGAD